MCCQLMLYWSTKWLTDGWQGKLPRQLFQVYCGISVHNMHVKLIQALSESHADTHTQTQACEKAVI